MRRRLHQRFAPMALMVCVVFLAGTILTGQSGAKNGEWRSYGADVGRGPTC